MTLGISTAFGIRTEKRSSERVMLPSMNLAVMILNYKSDYNHCNRSLIYRESRNMTCQSQTSFLTVLRTSRNGGTLSKWSERDLCHTHRFSVQKHQGTRLRAPTRL